jgi:ribonuclease VapC
MIIDSSALVAILRREPEASAFIAAVEAADSRRLSVATFVETSIIIEGKLGAAGILDLDRFISTARIELVNLDVSQAHEARAAFSRFGRGRHRAGLNYGDCFAYGLAKYLGESLLCKGNHFALTDASLVSY